MIKSILYLFSMLYCANSCVLDNKMEHLRLIREHNSKNGSWVMGENKFIGMSDDEFNVYYKGYNGYNRGSDVIVGRSRDVCYPESLDWVSRGVVTDVKNQGMCGSCWSFSATGALEGLYAIQTGRLVNFSEQDLVDCDTNDNGCHGGDMGNAFEYVKGNGICLNKDYIYSGKDGTCKCCDAAYYIEGYRRVSRGSYDGLMTALLKQPISIGIEADQSSFRFYKSGIFDGECGTNIDHGVLLVGYGEENGKKYWKVKNSWGTDWGEDGYIRMLRTGDDGSGICGIQLNAAYPY